MILHVDLSPAPVRVTLERPTDFREFKVTVSAGQRRVDDWQLANALGALGRFETPGYVFVERATVEQLAGGLATDADWRARLADMLELARANGWTDGAGAVRAHVEWAD
jgi:hypothetical protein